jgi:hypothetical protein
MTIARRLLLLAGAAPLVLVALGVFTHLELAAIESRSRFVAKVQVPSLSVLGNISRAFEEMRVGLRDHLLARDQGARVTSRQVFSARQAELDQLVRKYADTLVSDDRDRRLLDEFRASCGSWSSNAGELMALTDGGKGDEAARQLAGPAMAALGVRVGEVLREWIDHNQVLAAAAGDAIVVDLESARRHNRIALALALVLSGGLGF